MKQFLSIIWVSLIVLQLNAQSTIKLMTYNLLHFPSGTNIQDRKEDLRYILNDYQPDIFMVCELEDADGADQILNYCLGTTDYDAAYFTQNHSGSGYPLQQMLYFNKHKFELVNETYLVTYIRDINHYTLKLKTPNPDDEIFMDVYVAHLKASSGTDNERKRKDMVQVLVDDLVNIPNNHFVIFAGDFNLYSSYEPAYQLMTNPNNAVVFKDPVNRPGSWHNNTQFADLDTQSTHTVSDNDYVGGGLDDRFDFIMMSENLFNNPVLKYLPGTYKAYGNNGHCFNLAITNSSCDSPEYDSTLRNHLYRMSDHLPVVASLETPVTLASPYYTTNTFRLDQGNMVEQSLSISSDALPQFDINIYNMAGQKVLQKNNYEAGEQIDFDTYKNGIYFLEINSPQYHQVIKFVKAD
ncbi:MAG TPA: T9SS type A sorting domain-containing protein [Flavobacteriales bacterium]|jgi:endonuclease/exonuclease/phosphatase family metal-dependent hydrolase|nr:T9SS type A sorting domain-containing protein [Flavobacteriales bacterium]